jgi:adenylate kinase family enzyme
MKTDIILIGPVNAGKSTLGKLLSEKLGLPQISLDSVRFGYYKEIGYDEERAKQLRETEGFLSLYWYWKPFEAYAVERVLADHSNCVIDFGAGHSVFEDDALFRRVQSVLVPYQNVVLLLPSPDLDESVALLRQRDEFVISDFDFIEHFVRHHSNHDLAKFTVYTKDKTPEETCEEILAFIRAKGEE